MILTRSILESHNASDAAKVELGSCVTGIGDGAFSGYTNVNGIELPEGLETIGVGAFSGSSVESISIPSSVTSIGSYAFNSSSTTRVTMEGGTPPSVGTSAFTNNCTVLVPMLYYNDYTSATGWGDYIVIPDSSNFKAFFYGDGNSKMVQCNDSDELASSEVDRNYKNVIIGDCTKSIGYGAFSGTGSSITSIEIPSTVTSISERAFSNAEKLTKVKLNEGLLSIGSYAFYDTYFESITIPNSVTSMGSRCFAGNANSPANLRSFTFGSGLKDIPMYMFSGRSYLTTVVIPDGVESIGRNAFDTTPLTAITIPNTVTSIGISAFQLVTGTGCTLTIGSGSTSIGDNAFQRSSIVSADLGGTKSIGTRAFSNCNSLTSVTMNSVETISNEAFYGTRINSLTLPATIKSIGTDAFRNIPATEITILATTPPTLSRYNPFPSEITLYVPAASLDAYNTAYATYGYNIQAIS